MNLTTKIENKTITVSWDAPTSGTAAYYIIEVVGASNTETICSCNSLTFTSLPGPVIPNGVDLVAAKTGSWDRYQILKKVFEKHNILCLN